MVEDTFPEEIKKLSQQLAAGIFPEVHETYPVLFDYQSQFNPVYRSYLKQLRFDLKYPELAEIPFLPISFFKNFRIMTGKWQEQTVFRSSSTTGKGRSSHYIKDLQIYKAVSKQIFERRFGPIDQLRIMALLPGYLEREDSSLVYMVDYFMECRGGEERYFFLDRYHDLLEAIRRYDNEHIILFGVPYAFIRCFRELGVQFWSNVTMIETGGMKGKESEMTKVELHAFLRESFHPKAIYSEYGMTELLSQCYTHSKERFEVTDTMSMIVRELNDPFSVQKIGKPGVLNIFDMADVHTCSFIETEDMAILYDGGEFEILGRVDNREIRGCNLLAG